MFRFEVSYLHMRQYRVSRSFSTVAEAEEFIMVNAMVCALPGLIRHYVPFTGIHFLEF